MDHLSGMDASFLHIETPETPMHVGGLNILQLPPGYEGDFWEDVKAHIGRRLHLAPVFTRKLALMPFELANPVWVDDDDVDLDYHVRRVVLPKPGTRAQLETLVGRLHSTLLDRSRPLWECVVIEGLESGQAAFYTKAHHAGMDGAAGAVLANALLDVTAEPRAVKQPMARRARNDYQLGMAELAGAALKNTAMQYVKLVKLVPEVVKVTVKVAPNMVLPKDDDGKRRARLPKGLSLAPRTPLNVSITNQRVFAGISLPLADAKRVAKQLDATINDVVMTVCAGALRAYLQEHNALPKKSLMAAVPVSLREAGNTEMNNQATVMLVSLATDIADPVERLKAIHASSVDSKQFTGNIKAALPMDYPSFGAPWLVTGLVSLFGRSKLVNRLPPVTNLVISNVPGPQAPLYLAGARLLTNYPLSIPAHGMALNFTVQSYNGALDFGLTGCRSAVPDVRDLGEMLVQAMAELQAAVPAAVAAASAAAAAADAKAAEVAEALDPAPAKPIRRSTRTLKTSSAGTSRSAKKAQHAN